MNLLYLKSRIISSPAEPAFRWVRTFLSEKRANLELAEIVLEERRLPLILSRLLSSSSNVVDVGGHIGSFIGLAKQFAPEGNHTVIEASRAKAEWLRARLPQCRIESVAVSDRSGTAIFHEDPQRPGYSKLVDTLGANCYEVKTTTLDALNLGSVNLVKLDIEGAELAALRGATTLIEHHKPALLFECGSIYVEGLDREALFDHITQTMRYDVFTFADFLHDKGPLSYDEFRKCGTYPFTAFNYVAVPKRRASTASD